MTQTQEVVKQLVWQRRLFLAINIISAVSIAILFWFIHAQNTRIQQERRNALLRVCQDQNARNKHTIQTLDKLIEKLPPDRQAAAEASRAYTVLLINSLAPHQDCLKLIRISVKS